MESLSRIISDIAFTEPKLHMISLSGNFGYDAIKSTTNPYKANSNPMRLLWRDAYVSRRDGFYLKIYLNPNRCYLPRCYIQIIPFDGTTAKQYKILLRHMATDFPGIQLAKVEYATDIYVKPQSFICRLLSLIEKFLYLRNQKAVMYFGQSTENENMGIRYGSKIVQKNKPLSYAASESEIENQMGESDYKIYERGMDRYSEKENDLKSWALKDIDRIRMEYTAKKDALARHGIKSLDDFIDNPKFFVMNTRRTKDGIFPIWKFMLFDQNLLMTEQFKNRNFQTVYIEQSKQFKQLSRMLKPAYSLGWLTDQMITKYQDFDNEWQAI